MVHLLLCSAATLPSTGGRRFFYAFDAVKRGWMRDLGGLQFRGFTQFLTHRETVCSIFVQSDRAIINQRIRR